MPSAQQDQNEDDRAIKQQKIKNLIKSLSAAKGNGTSMVSLIVPPKDSLPKLVKMLSDEMQTATNIKSRVNRMSVVGAINSTIQRLKLYQRIPTNGLVLFCGVITTIDGKEKKLNIDFEPFKPINTSLWMCDNRFHTEPLNELLEDDNTFGFIVMDGNGCLFATLSGSNRNILHKFSVELPKKHGRGGQSAVRFARLREEKRHNYIRKVAEQAAIQFINDDKPNINGLILAGSAAFKQELANSEIFDFRLKAVTIKIVDVSYGGENGFNQAIEMSAEALANVKFISEKRLLTSYMSEIAQDTGKYCFGISDTLKALELGAVETLIVWENLDVTRFKLRNNATGEERVFNLSPEEAKDSTYFHDSKTGLALDVLEEKSLLEQIADNYKNQGAKLEFITDRSQEGSQFCKGFGGIGGLLRYKLDFLAMESDDDDGFEDDDDNFI